MKDRELLELAAKAVNLLGIDKWLYDDAVVTFPSWWNPLEDDGDALRLAVKLGLGIRQGVNLVAVWGGVNCTEENYRDHNHDRYTATRHAIVRAAAEIGRKM